MKLYNTLSRTVEDFEPIDKKNVRMYTCGPTVYREIHIGNLRTYITSDILRQVLRLSGFTVTSVMNITDVGHMRYSSEKNRQIDPIMVEAEEKGITPLELSQQYTTLFLGDAQKLHIEAPDVMPKATEHIPEMIEIIKILIKKGLAYTADGNVYFDVDKFSDYGKLSGNTLDKMDELLEAVRVSVETDKKDSADFALWKRAPADSVMKWESPWGEGVPGWHIECSAMSIRYLGDTFDIHAGGEDLIFPHHEDEIAQSEGATGKKFVNYWVHSNWLLVDSEKMSRSKRNVYVLKDIEEKGFAPLAFRFLTYQTHYRARMNFTYEALEASQTALDKLYEAASNLSDPTAVITEFENKFFNAVTNDLDMPKAVTLLWDVLRSDYSTGQKAATLFMMDEVFGLHIRAHAEAMKNIPEEIKRIVADREKLRKMKKFHLADQLRAKVEKKGFITKDTKKGTKIFRKI